METTHRPIAVLAALLLSACSARVAPPQKAERHDASAGGSTGRANVGADGAGGAFQPIMPMEDQGCPLIGCVAGITLEMAMPVPYAELRTLGIEVCLNTTCLTGSFAGIDATPPADDSRVGTTFPDGPTIDSTHSAYAYAAVIPKQNGAHRLHVDYRPRDQADLKDGDHFVVSLTRASGDTVVRFERTVTYASRMPMGPCAAGCPSAWYDVPDGG